jgi:hypothetical protein
MNVTSSMQNRKLAKITPNNSKKPWGVYLADNYTVVNETLKTGVIPDSSSNNRPAATTINVTKALHDNFKLPVIAGTTTAQVVFPPGSLPPIYTILSVTRYSTTINRNRIIVSPELNFTHSHYEGGNAKFYNNGVQVTSVLPGQPNSRLPESWCVSISTNSPLVDPINRAAINNIYMGIARAANTDANVSLGIGNSHHGTAGSYFESSFTDQSDFQFYALVIYDQGLTATEMSAVSTKYMNLMVNQNI